MIDTDLMRSAPIGPGRDSKRSREQERREALRHVAAQALENVAGLLDQPARRALLVAAELRLDVHGSLPAQARFA
jgi:hypothetical protein